VGGGGAFSAAVKICLNKIVNYTHFIIKSSLKMTVLLKIPETKEFADIFCEAFF
jgi:hypothetical protein